MQPPRPDNKQRTPRNEGRDKVENAGRLAARIAAPELCGHAPETLAATP
jgi:hypothetical protein